ncbi:MAG: hypothetical protein ACLGSA_11910 [Acidobacteriota bacterium]
MDDQDQDQYLLAPLKDPIQDPIQDPIRYPISDPLTGCTPTPLRPCQYVDY